MIGYLAIVVFVICIVAVVFGIYFVRFYCDLECDNLWEICGYILSKFPKDFIHTFNGNKGEWGTFGDFVGGTLNPILSFFGFMALLYTVKMQRKQLDDTDKFQAKQQFESTFFELLKMHNENLSKLNVEDIGKRLFNQCLTTKNFNNNKTDNSVAWKACESDEFPVFCYGRKVLEKEPMYQHYFRILYQLLRFIATNTPDSEVGFNFTIQELKKNASNSEKMYSNIVRASLPDNLIKLVVAYAYCKKGTIDDSYYKFRLLIERYAFFENHLFEQKNSPFEQCWEFFDKRAFGNAKDPRKSIMTNNNGSWSLWLKIKNGIVLKIGSCRLFFMRW
jgi:hypothetical protein